MTRAAAALALLLAACAPFYRDAELRARRADDAASVQRLVAEGERALAVGDAARAERLLGDALAVDPELGAPVYLALAQAQAAAGRRAEARATARFALERRRADGAAPGLRALLVETYAADGLPSRALDFVDGGDLDVPALASVYAPLLEARRLAWSRPDEALDRYAAWVTSYGVPDHPLLRAARDRILAAAPTASIAERARAALRGDDPVAAVRAAAVAWRYLPPDRFSSLADDFARAAAALPDPAAPSPLARGEAARGDAALAGGRLGDALHAYRRAVAAAPWWAEAHRRLALLLAQAELREDAVLEIDWYLKLARAAPETEQARRLRAEWSLPPEERARRERLVEAELGRRQSAAAARRRAGVALVTVGAAAAVVAGVFAWLGARVNDQIAGGGFATGAMLDDAYQGGQRDNRAAIGLAVAAAVLAAVGAPLVLSGLRVGDADLVRP